MDRFRELSTFVAVAEAGAFNAAARALGASPAAVTRLISALERRLGARLFVRSTRRVRLTETGRRLLADAKAVLADLEAAEAEAAGAGAAPMGELRVTAPVMFGELHIAPIVRAFLDRHPQMTAVTLFTDRVVDLIEEGLDVAVRIGPLPDSDLTARRVCAVRRLTVAAPAYLERAGRPETPAALSAHRIVHPTGLAPRAEWVFTREGRTETVRVKPALTVNTMTTAIDAACAGWGVTRVLSYQAAAALRSGDLETVLEDWDGHVAPVHLVHAEGRTASAKIRAFSDMAVDWLRCDPDLA